MQKIDSNIIDDRMLEKAVNHLINLLKVEYALLLENKIKEVIAIQNKKSGVLKFLDAQGTILSDLLDKGSLQEHISAQRCSELKALALELKKHIYSVKSALESKAHISKNMLKAVQEVVMQSNLQNSGYKAKGRHVGSGRRQEYVVMNENV